MVPADELWMSWDKRLLSRALSTDATKRRGSAPGSRIRITHRLLPTKGRELGRADDLLFGRITFEIFASYWPEHPEEGSEINSATKYVASNTLTIHEWNNSVFLNGDVVEKIKKLKQQAGPDLQVHGSGTLVQTLLEHDLVDEFWLKIFLVTLGMEKRLFGTGTIPAAFTAGESTSSPA